MSERLDDVDARIDYLIAGGVLDERADGTVVTTEEFEHRRGIYLDSYVDLSDERFEATVAETFDLSVEDAAERIGEFGVTRQQLATFLALDAHLDDPSVSREELGALAALVTGVDPATPVPDSLDDVTDGYDEYIESHGDVVVFVWRQACEPCEAMQEELDDIRAAAPGRVAFAGVDGESAPEFRREFEVDVAPTTLVFAGGDLVASLEGRHRPDQLAEVFDAAYE